MLDEPTLGLDILYRKQFYQSLLEDYFDENKTIIVTTHQVEEVEHILTDLMFIRDGKIVLDATMDEVGERFVEVLVNRRPGSTPPARSSRSTSAQIFGKTDLPVRRRRPRAPGRAGRNPHTPSVADLFVATMKGTYA